MKYDNMIYIPPGYIPYRLWTKVELSEQIKSLALVEKT